MSSFIIKLLTPVGSKAQKISFLETTISEFYIQEEQYNFNINNFANRKQTYCYTFNEHLSKHSNGQKELSFSMLRNIWLDDKLTVNPFLSSLQNGSQILLIDKYKNEYFFTIKDIKFNFKKDNMIYEFSCQDSFTYQLIRQNDGYTIDNNSDDENFIGAKNIDWWVYNRISHDCYIGYTYIPLFQGLYLDKNYNLHTYLSSSELVNVEKIIKPIYDKDNYPEYYEEIPFSASGSNASAALISLGENLDFNLNYCENNIKENNIRTTKFDRFFWYEPSKKEETTGLKYSPNTSISSFSLDYKGDSLTTVLNVEANEVNDKLITLIPEVPLFFRSLFNSNEWKHTKYVDGYFSSICQGTTYILKDGSSSDNIEYYTLISQNSNTEIVTETDKDNNIISKYLKIKIWNTNNSDKKFLLPKFYDLISFEKDNVVSSLYLDKLRLTPHTSLWEFIVDGNAYNNTFSSIPLNMQGKYGDVYIKITLSTDFDTQYIKNIDDSQIVLNFYRQASAEELEFAEIADKCPWLENKLIDLSFFLNQNIISKSEYNKIWDSIKNNLRIVNGQLLLYSASYYDAIHKKTKTISSIINDLDSLGAAFQADFVNTYAEKGVVNDISKFNEAYETVLSNYLTATTPTAIVNYNDLLTDYFNKYYKAQQRFLKNIYNFTKYFNTPIDWGEKNKLYKYNITINNTINNTKENNYITLQENHFNLLKKDFDKYNKTTGESFVTIFASDKINTIQIVDQNNYKKFFYNLGQEDLLDRNDGTEGYNPHKIYYRRLYRFDLKSLGKSSLPNQFIYNQNLYIKHSIDDKYVYYGRSEPDARIIEWDNSIRYNGFVGTRVTKEVKIQEIISEYLYNKGYNENKNQCGIKQWFYHNNNTLSNTNTWIKPSNQDGKEEKLLKTFTPLVWLKSIGTSQLNLNLEQIGLIVKAFLNNKNKISEESKTFIKNAYYKFFPITELKLVNQPSYIKRHFSIDINNTRWETNYQRTNAKNETVQDYIEYWINKQKNLDVKEVLNPTKYTKTYTIPLINNQNESKYYRRTLNIGKNLINKNFLTTNFWETITDWNTSGFCYQNIYGDYLKDENGSIYFNNGFMDINQWVYTLSQNAYDEYVKLKEDRWENDFIGTIDESTKSAGNNNPIIIDSSGAVIRNKVDLASYTYKDEKGRLKTNYLINDPSNLDSTIGTNFFDKYAFIGLTYKNVINQSNTNIQFEDSWLRPLLLTDKINPKCSYKILIQDSGNNTSLVFASDSMLDNLVQYSTTNRFDSNTRFSKIIYYPLVNLSQTVDLSGLDLKDNNSLKEVLVALGWNDVNSSVSYFITGTFNNISYKFLFLQEEDFIRQSILSSDSFNTKEDTGKIYIYADNRYSLYNGQEIWDDYNGKTINFFKQSDLLKGLYYVPDRDNLFVSSEDLKWEDIQEYHLYSKTNNEFNRVYTVEQLKNSNNTYYYLGSTNYQFNSWETDFKKPLKIFLHKDKYENKKLISSETKEMPGYFNFIINKDKIEQATQVVLEDGIDKYSISYTITREEQADLSNISNGQFWYEYHSNTDNPVLLEKAAVIETQLTTFWNQAYSSSLYCEYFIPEYWQPSINGSTNYFSNQLFTIDKKNKIHLSNKILPQVSLISHNGNALLPSYVFKYNNNNSISEDIINQKINEVNTTYATEIANNEAFNDIFNNLNESIKNFSVEIIPNVNTNYYSGSGGLKWKNIIPTLSSINTIYSSFDGLYIMTYKILKNSFINQSFETYEELKNEQHNIWSSLYKEYSGILLESVYSNSDAVTSKQLYSLASNFLKDKMEPEKGYSIAIIDTNTLNGYVGQELSIGSSIEVNASDYYDKNDFLLKTLSQYLYITDISYDLRVPSDIQLTVNSIKYQEKLIQRLVKLIK